VPNSPRPFEEFARKISRIRKDAKSRGDQVLDRLAKEVGNSAYGKIAQAPSLPKGQSRTTSIADECLTLKQTRCVSSDPAGSLSRCWRRSSPARCVPWSARHLHASTLITGSDR